MPTDSPRVLLGQFCTWMGPIVTFGGMIALIRTGEPSWFYVSMAPIGLVMWCAGLWLTRHPPEDHDAPEGAFRPGEPPNNRPPA